VKRSWRRLNGYAWDAGDNNYVVGWKGTGDASFTLHFETALLNIDGDDPAVKVYGGATCKAENRLCASVHQELM